MSAQDDAASSAAPKVVSPEQWAAAKTHGYAADRDGTPYMLYLDEGTQATVWGPVEIHDPLT